MAKFDRRYRLTITVPSIGEDVVIETPITAQFVIRRGFGTSLNSMDIQVINLSRETRDKIFQDRFTYYSDYIGKIESRLVKLEAGYGDNLYTVFYGVMFESYHMRQGADVITHINVRDGGFDTVQTQIFQTVQAPVTQKRLIEIMTEQFPNIDIGAIADDGVIFNRPVSLTGNVYDNIIKYTDSNATIDLQKLYYLRDFEVVDEEVFIINADTGLLQSPRREDAFLSVVTLFEPQVAINRLVQMESTIQPRYNGLYKIINIKHNCIMSGAVGGECQTVLGLLIGGQITGEFRRVPLAANEVV